MLDLTYCKPLGIIALPNTKECVEGIITRNHETRKVGQKLPTDVKEDEEEVECDEAEESVDLWEASLLLEVVQSVILRKFLINVRDVILSLRLNGRHDDVLLLKLRAVADGVMRNAYCVELRTKYLRAMLDKCWFCAMEKVRPGAGP